MPDSSSPETEIAPGHAGRLTVSLGALVQNWRLLQKIAAPAECGAVVKADAYGLGIAQVVPALVAAGCRSFFVAHAAEAAQARRHAGPATVYVLNGLPPGTAGAIRAADARPVLGTVEELDEWQAGGGGPFALHVDTGMNRLGLRFDEAQQVLGDAVRMAGLCLLMSHFASAEDPGEPLTDRQIDRFADIAARRPDVPASLANSSGHFLARRPFFDLTRPGYALYGGNPTPERDNPMAPVIRLEAMIVQLRAVPKGETVGYNARWRARRPSRIAILSIGYADGILRTIHPDTGEKPPRRVMIAGRPCPLIGSVSMDLAAVDVTDVPEADLRRGAFATLIGDGITLDAAGAMAGTVGYELLTDLGHRYARHYLPA